MSRSAYKCLLAAALLSPLAAMADGNYLKIGVGHSTFAYSGGFPDDHPTGFVLAYGAQLDPVWGVEGGLIDFGRVDVIDNNNNPAKLNTRALYGAGTGTWPINPQASVYGKLGLAVKHFSGSGDSATQTSVLAGAGLRWMFSREWGMAAEYAYYGKNGGLTLSQASISAIYNF